MTPERWQQVEHVLDRILEQDPDQWSVLLDEACGNDEQLRREVRGLLQYHTRTERGLQAPPGFRIDLLESCVEGSHDIEGQRIGPYRLVHMLGRGGMGTVYLAERADGAFEKKVALKVVKRGLDTDLILRRFLSERQILAQLEHPFIARLLDGGVTSGGRPYFAMEYVRGKPITTYCNAHQLPVQERLKLFRDVCGAVEHAHRNLIVHRDLKPSNVLVTEEGKPKLLDFGVAKLLDPERPDAASLTQTGLSKAPMTPAYAAPEQARGASVTTATDVYALGALLYELLAGSRPYSLEGLSASEVERAICETLPKPPSRAVRQAQDGRAAEETRSAEGTPEATSQNRQTRPRKLRRALRGDLDAVVLKALRKEPERRYSSAADLQGDLERYLADRPVTAQQDSAWYRARKFVRRHQKGVALVAALVLLLLGYAATVTVQTKRVRAALEEARIEAQQAKKASALAVDLFPITSPQKAKGELLRQRVKRLKRELDDQPEVRAHTLNLAGQIYQALGLYDQAQPLLEASLNAQRQLLSPPHPDIASSMSDLATLLTQRGQYARADSLFREAVGQWERIRAAALQKVGLRRIEMEKAEALNNHGLLLSQRGGEDREAEARTLYQEALALQKRWTEGPHPEVATTLNNLGALLKGQDKLEAAAPLLRKALQMRKTLGEELGVANSLNNLASLRRNQAKFDTARSLHRQALDTRERLLGKKHPEVINSLKNLGVALRDEGKYAAAEPLLRRALRVRQERFGEEHPLVASAAYSLGVLLHQTGNYAAADSLFRRSLQIEQKVYGEKHEYVGMDLRGLGALAYDRGRPSEAKRRLEAALNIFESTLAAGHWRTARAHSELGACLTALGRYEEAESHLRRGFATLKEKRGPHDMATKQVLKHLIALYKAWGQEDQALRYRALLDENTLVAASQ